MNRSLCLWLVIVVAVLPVKSQNTITPLPLHVQFPGITTSLTDTSIFNPNPQTMLLGHQWGSAK